MAKNEQGKQRERPAPMARPRPDLLRPGVVRPDRGESEAVKPGRENEAGIEIDNAYERPQGPKPGRQRI